MAINKRESTKELVQRGIKYQNSANWKFDLGAFRYHVAAMCKYTIRARLKAEREFLLDEKTLRRWGLEIAASDGRSCSTLLSMAKDAADLVRTDILDMDGSGGLDAEDPFFDFKDKILEFLDPNSPDLLEAIELAASEDGQKNIDWSELAKWEVLAPIRDVLDCLPEPQVGAPPPRLGSKQKVPDRYSHSVDFRSIIWDGKPYEFTGPQAAAVKILWEHWERGTQAVGGGTICRAIESAQIRLDLVFRSNRAWGTVIVPGDTKGTYRLNAPRPKSR